MSYVDEVYAMVVEKNPAQPEFHQAVKEVLESLRVVIEANEEAYKKDALLERIVTPEYADMIKADAYCKDAMGAVRYVESYFA